MHWTRVITLDVAADDMLMMSSSTISALTWWIRRRPRDGRLTSHPNEIKRDFPIVCPNWRIFMQHGSWNRHYEISPVITEQTYCDL